MQISLSPHYHIEKSPIPFLVNHKVHLKCCFFRHIAIHVNPTNKIKNSDETTYNPYEMIWPFSFTRIKLLEGSWSGFRISNTIPSTLIGEAKITYLVLRMEARMDDPIHVKVEIVIFLSIGVWLNYSVWQLDVLFHDIHHNAWVFVR